MTKKEFLLMKLEAIKVYSQDIDAELIMLDYDKKAYDLYIEKKKKELEEIGENSKEESFLREIIATRTKELKKITENIQFWKFEKRANKLYVEQLKKEIQGLSKTENVETKVNEDKKNVEVKKNKEGKSLEDLLVESNLKKNNDAAILEVGSNSENKGDTILEVNTKSETKEDVTLEVKPKLETKENTILEVGNPFKKDKNSETLDDILKSMNLNKASRIQDSLDYDTNIICELYKLFYEKDLNFNNKNVISEIQNMICILNSYGFEIGELNFNRYYSQSDSPISLMLESIIVTSLMRYESIDNIRITIDKKVASDIRSIGRRIRQSDLYKEDEEKALRLLSIISFSKKYSHLKTTEEVAGYIGTENVDAIEKARLLLSK